MNPSDRIALQPEIARACQRLAAEWQWAAQRLNLTGKLGFGARPAEKRPDYVIEITWLSQRTAHDPLLHQFRLFGTEIMAMTQEQMRKTCLDALAAMNAQESGR